MMCHGIKAYRCLPSVPFGKSRRILGVFLVWLTACSKPLATISVSENDGLDRKLEYVATSIRLVKPLSTTVSNLQLIDTDTGEAIPFEIGFENEASTEVLQVRFPVKINANTTKEFTLHDAASKTDTLLVHQDASISDFSYSSIDNSIENSFYKATFSTKTDSMGGQIDGIYVKEFNNVLLKRGHIAMHWAPNFSKNDSDGYFNMESTAVFSNNQLSPGYYEIRKSRSVITDNVPEISVEGTYAFYKSLPYFTFESTMSVSKDVVLDLLRNDEMTMDSLFTHVMYAKSRGGVMHLKLYDAEMDVLEQNPIPDDAPWLAFYHREEGYGFGVIRLKYDNTNSTGGLSPTYKPYTKITKSTENGRYWNRILIADTVMVVPKGSRYVEKNAYLVFKVGSIAPEREIRYYAERLRNPLNVTVETFDE